MEAGQVQGQAGHWTESQAGFTPEMKTAYAKYDTPDAALKGGFEAMKTVGKPFRLPESLDKLGDDKTKGELADQVGKLYGLDLATAKALTSDLIADDAGFEGFNFTDGMAEGEQADETMMSAFKAFAVENKLPKGVAQKTVSFYNNLVGQFKAAQAEAIQGQMKATNEALVKHFGGEDKVKEMSEMVKRAFMSKAASPEAFEKTGLALVESAITRNPDLAIPFMEMIAPYAQEGGTHVGDGGTKATGPMPIEKQLAKTGKALGW